MSAPSDSPTSGLVLPFREHEPVLGADVFIAPTAAVIGDVVLEDGVNVWFGAVIRGDCEKIRVGARTNIQDLACLHTTTDVSETHVGADVTVGHGAILHGCRVGDRCLIGMGAIVLDNAVVGEGSVVAAGALVTPRTVIPPRSLVRGSPAKVIREVTESEARLGIAGAEHYASDARTYREMLAKRESEEGR